jgi:hypothetical protein
VPAEAKLHVRVEATRFASLWAVYKPPGLPTLSKDCVDLHSLEAALCALRKACGPTLPTFPLSRRVEPQLEVDLAFPRGHLRQTILGLGDDGPGPEEAASALEEDAGAGAEAEEVPARRPSIAAACLTFEAAPLPPDQQLRLPEQGILHRLDNATEGWVLVATNPEAHAAYTSLRSRGLVAAHYRATVSTTPTTHLARIAHDVLVRHLTVRRLPLRNNAVLVDAAKDSHGNLELQVTSGFAQHDARVGLYAPTAAATTKRGFWGAEAAPARGHPDAEQDTRTVTRTSKLTFSAASLAPLLRDAGRYLQLSRSRQRYAEVDGSLPTHALQVDCQLSRGMRHQLRVQLAALRAPIVGDTLYGSAPALGRNGTAPRLKLSCLGYSLAASHGSPPALLWWPPQEGPPPTLAEHSAAQQPPRPRPARAARPDDS